MDKDIAARPDGPRVIAQHRNSYIIEDASGTRKAEAAGRLLHHAGSPSELPVVGDRVVLRPNVDDPAIITEIAERSGLLVRKAAGQEVVDQPLVANVDHVFVVCGLDREVNLRSIERYLTVAWSGGAAPVVVLSKADMSEDPWTALETVENEFPGVDAFVVDSLNGDVSFAERYLEPGRTVALLGPSGAGKSTLLNRLGGSEATGAVRGDGKGRHTTVARHLVTLPSGAAIVDTPGLRELALWGDEDTADRTFDEILTIAEGCRFRDCAHDKEPGCAIRSALEEGGLDRGRYDSYLKLKRELRALNIRKDVHAQKEEKRKWKRLNSDARARARTR